MPHTTADEIRAIGRQEAAEQKTVSELAALITGQMGSIYTFRSEADPQVFFNAYAHLAGMLDEVFARLEAATKALEAINTYG
jgi:hypothetical protein